MDNTAIMNNTIDHVKLDVKTLLLIVAISFGALFSAVVGVSLLYLNAKFDGVDTRFDSVQANIQEIKEGQRDLDVYMKDHEGRISRVETELKLLQQPAT